MEQTEQKMFNIKKHMINRVILKWGTYGKDGLQKLKYVTPSQMSNEHLSVLIGDGWTDGMPKDLCVTIHNEVWYRYIIKERVKNRIKSLKKLKTFSP